MFASKPFRYTLFVLLYFSQGAMLSYFTALNALYLLSFDLDMTQIGLFSGIVMIPFVLKIFLGMLSDRVNLFGRGHRQPYIVLGLIVQAACLFVVPFVNPGTHFTLFALTAFVLMTGMALYDTCTDGLALDTTVPEEEGTVQGFMIGGRALGVVVVSAALGLLVHLSNWTVGFWALGVVTLLPLVLVVWVREPQRTARRAFEWRAFRAFGRPQVFLLALLGALYSLLTYGANEIVNPFLQQEYYRGQGDQTNYITAGLYTAVWGIGVVLGGLTGGRLTDRVGHKRAILGAMIASVVTILALALIPSPVLAYPIVLIFGIAFGYYDTVYLAASMAFSDTRIAASMFAILMAVGNVGTGIGFAVSGGLVDVVGYRWTFAVLAVLNVLALPLIAPIFRGRERAVLETTGPSA